jgi:hypothetical protein
LDFTKGRELFNIGQTYNNCTLIQLCWFLFIIIFIMYMH